MGAQGRQLRQRTIHKHNQLNEVVQYKTACSWSLLLLHNTVGGAKCEQGFLVIVKALQKIVGCPVANLAHSVILNDISSENLAQKLFAFCGIFCYNDR